MTARVAVLQGDSVHTSQIFRLSMRSSSRPDENWLIHPRNEVRGRDVMTQWQEVVRSLDFKSLTNSEIDRMAIVVQDPRSLAHGLFFLPE